MSEEINVKDYCDCLRRHIQAQQGMQDTFGRLQMPDTREKVKLAGMRFCARRV
jgi:hypothetical protein